MFTEVKFINKSLNCHHPNVVFFQELDNDEILVWKNITHCHYLWMHTFRFQYEFNYQLFDEYGNYTSLNEFAQTHSNEIEVAYNEASKMITFNKLSASKYNGVCLSKDNKILSRRKFINGSVQFHLSNMLSVCADVRLKEGNIINPCELNISYTKFDLSTLRYIEIVMLGGEPGIHSTPIKFVIEKAKK
jgi:hypothetical protein